MQIKFSAEPTGDALAYLAFEGGKDVEFGEGADAKAQAAFRRAISAGSFKGGAGQVIEILAPEFSDSARVLLVGLGKKASVTENGWQRAAGVLVKRLLVSGAKSLSIVGAPDRGVAANLAFGARLAAYRFDQYRLTLKPEKKPSLTTVTIVTDSAAGARSDYAPLSARAEGVELARNLVSEPPNVLHPESYAERIQELNELGLEIEVLDVPAMTKLGMGSLLGVGQGSVRGSRLCVMKWMGAKDKKTAPVALIGKGVTFDSGGISLKPGPGMGDMKGDMGGSAAVVGAMVAIAKRKAKANVVGLVGLVENMPDGNAQRPGDIVKAAAGKTIEILNTDAEGRLVLADVLWYAQKKFNPKAMIDLATLTGAIIVSLGNEHAGVFSNNDDLVDKLSKAGKSEGENVWRLPLAPGYDKQIDSDVADMKNIGIAGNAGSIVAAQFLQRFVDDGRAWAHLDIAGTAWRPGHDNPLEPTWATGWGVRILDRLIADNYED
jgi:leucyl aminopeptidase